MTRLPRDDAAIAALAKLRDLPVFAELEAAHGPAGAGSGPHLAGTPVTMHTGVTRMVWVWFEDGHNRNIAIDTASADWPWQIRAAGPDGLIRFEQTSGQPPAQDLIRAVAVAAGLLISRSDDGQA